MDGDTVSARLASPVHTPVRTPAHTPCASTDFDVSLVGPRRGVDTPEPPTTPPSPDDVGTASAEEVPQSGLAERRSSSADMISYTGPGSRPIAKVSSGASDEHERSLDDVDLYATIARYRTRYVYDRKFIQYEVIVTVSDLRWSVFRRYSEFEAFHKKVHKLMSQVMDKSTLPLPRLPGKRLYGNLEDKFLEERRVALQRYLQQVMAIPGMMNNVSLMEFLGMLADHSKESKKRKHLQADTICKVSKPGDLILFRTQGTLPAMQRMALSSAYDHVGIIVSKRMSSISRRFHGSSGLFLLESTNEGVHSYPLKTRLRAWHLSGATMALRKLDAPSMKQSTVEKKLQDFTGDEEGKRYGLNPIKLIRRKAGEQHDTYFCSELVASAYQAAGVLPKNVAANSFYPSSFADKHELKMIDGARLSPEIYLEFWQPECQRARVSHDYAGNRPSRSGRRGRAFTSSASPISRKGRLSPARGGLRATSSADQATLSSDIVVTLPKDGSLFPRAPGMRLPVLFACKGAVGEDFEAELTSMYANHEVDLNLTGQGTGYVIPDEAIKPGKYRLKLFPAGNPFLSGYSGSFTIVDRKSSAKGEDEAGDAETGEADAEERAGPGRKVDKMGADATVSIESGALAGVVEKT